MQQVIIEVFSSSKSVKNDAELKINKIVSDGMNKKVAVVILETERTNNAAAFFFDSKIAYNVKSLKITFFTPLTDSTLHH